MAIISKLHNLVELAREKSSDRRRELLREVTDLFFDEAPDQESQVSQEFDDVLSVLAEQTAVEARTELAERFAEAPLAPHGLVLQLAQDAIEVAAPILAKSNVLTEDDLVNLATESAQEHLQAISQREDVSPKVSEKIVQHGNDKTIAKLIENDGARLSRDTFETVTAKAEVSISLQAPLVNREDTPTDLLGDLMLSVEHQLRDQILERFAEIDPDTLETALSASRQRRAKRIEDDRDLEIARSYIRKKAVRKQLDGALLARLLREKEMHKFYVGFAELSGVDVTAARRAIEQASVDPLALICKAAEFNKTLFVTLAVLRAANTANGFADAKELGELYDGLDPADAERALRFWRMRKDMAA